MRSSVCVCVEGGRGKWRRKISSGLSRVDVRNEVKGITVWVADVQRQVRKKRRNKFYSI